MASSINFSKTATASFDQGCKHLEIPIDALDVAALRESLRTANGNQSVFEEAYREGQKINETRAMFTEEGNLYLVTRTTELDLPRLERIKKAVIPALKSSLLVTAGLPLIIVLIRCLPVISNSIRPAYSNLLPIAPFIFASQLLFYTLTRAAFHRENPTDSLLLVNDLTKQDKFFLIKNNDLNTLKTVTMQGTSNGKPK